MTHLACAVGHDLSLIGPTNPIFVQGIRLVLLIRMLDLALHTILHEAVLICVMLTCYTCSAALIVWDG